MNREFLRGISEAGVGLLLKGESDENLLQELRNRIMTANENWVVGNDGTLGGNGRVREILDFLLIEYDARNQSRTVDSVRKEWERRYHIDAESVDPIRNTWKHREEVTA